MRLLHLSDMHFGGEDKVAIAAVTRFAQTARPDLIVASGDLSLLGRQGELEDASAWLAGLGAPVIATPGNHDVPYHEALGRLYKPFRRYDRAATGRLAGAWSGAGACIVTINTARGWQLRANWALGAISPMQSERACAELRAARQGALKIVVTHHPLLFPADAPIAGQTHGGRRAARELIAAGAQIFLAGHLHVTQETRVRGQSGDALALAAGTLSLRLRGEAAGCLLLDFADARAVAVSRCAIVEGEVRAGRPDLIALD